MLNKTKELIELLKGFNSKKELMDFIIQKHSEFKDMLSKEGIKFHSSVSNLSNEIIGDQIITVEKYTEYEELNFIKYGLEKNWVVKVDNIERFDEIRKEVDSIVQGLD